SGPIRLDALASSQARLRLPAASVVRQMSSAIEVAINRAPGADLEWVRGHFIHHEGKSYFVIPNLYSAAQGNREEERRALAMNQLAGVFDDLKVVRALTAKELKRFGKEEMRESYSDLTPFRDKNDRAKIQAEQARGWRERVSRTPPAPVPAPTPVNADGEKRIRNHGLLSKSQRALDIAGWSAAAQSDVEIYSLVDTEGLTPLLTLINEANLVKGAASATAALQAQEKTAKSPLVPVPQEPLRLEHDKHQDEQKT
ncbi:MAG: hypothetical protein ACREC6_00135, partial [Hyphomicrobiaceae bacterium]